MEADTPPLTSERLLNQIRERARFLDNSLATDKAYLYGMHLFVRWHGLRYPRDTVALEVETFLTLLTRAPAARAEAVTVLADVMGLEHSFCRYNNHAYPV